MRNLQPSNIDKFDTLIGVNYQLKMGNTEVQQRYIRNTAFSGYMWRPAVQNPLRLVGGAHSFPVVLPDCEVELYFSGLESYTSYPTAVYYQIMQGEYEIVPFTSGHPYGYFDETGDYDIFRIRGTQSLVLNVTGGSFIHPFTLFYRIVG